LLTILLALAFSLVVCAVVGVGASAILARLVAYTQKQRDRVSANW
jgi:type II secretory pathway pseudopilin PulG